MTLMITYLLVVLNSKYNYNNFWYDMLQTKKRSQNHLVRMIKWNKMNLIMMKTKIS
jgi:hypothetical protein